MQLRVPITLTPGRPRRAPPWALEAYSTPSPRPIPRAPPRAPSGPAALLAPPPLPATARSRALGPVTGRSSGPWSGILGLFFLFPAPARTRVPLLVLLEALHRPSRRTYLVLLDRADHCGQVDVQHAAARGRKAGAMCVERLQPLLASCSNALDWLRLSLAPQQRSAQDSCTAIVRNRRRAACGGRASIGAQRHICWAIAWAHHAATLRESACDREGRVVEPYSRVCVGRGTRFPYSSPTLPTRVGVE